MAYGSIDSLDELEAYLLDIRSGRPVSPELLAEFRHRYELIGGSSPLLKITRQQAAALQDELNRRFQPPGIEFQAFVGMRHWQPRIHQAVADICAQGFTRIIGLVMAPHQSRMSTGAYFSILDKAVSESGAQVEVIRIDSWHDAPGFIGALAEHAQAAMEKFELPPFVLFSAHSLPARILQQGDPYDHQLHQTAQLVADKLGLAEQRWKFCYQSAGQSAEPWLGPPIEQVIEDLCTQGEKNILVIPIGFVCDHVEVLYDIDIEARAIAQKHGARLERSQSLNTSPVFIHALAEIVGKYAYPLSGD
jgi:ferrochelatase